MFFKEGKNKYLFKSIALTVLLSLSFTIVTPVQADNGSAKTSSWWGVSNIVGQIGSGAVGAVAGFAGGAGLAGALFAGAGGVLSAPVWVPAAAGTLIIGGVGVGAWGATRLYNRYFGDSYADELANRVVTPAVVDLGLSDTWVGTRIAGTNVAQSQSDLLDMASRAVERGVDNRAVQTATRDLTYDATHKNALGASNDQLNPPTTAPPFAGLLEIIAKMIAWFLYIIAMALGWIMMLIAQGMLAVATYNNFLREGMVQTGWRIVRDICNNFFIILLLITAISTMLRQGEFKDWRSMLPKILIASVLINFSLLMCGIFIDISQIFTLTFASPLNSIEGYNVVLAAMGIPQMFQLSDLVNGNLGQITSGINPWDLVAALLYATVVTFVAMVVILAITVVLVFRAVMLWFLIILSPLPFLLSVFKKGATYASQWWSEFTKYLIVGPVMMFFLYLSFMAMGQMDNTGVAGNSSTILGIEPKKATYKIGEGTVGAGTEAVSLSNAADVPGLLNFLTIIGLMVGSLMMAQKMAVGGSKFAGQSLGWLQKQGKRWSGFNLGKSALTTAAKAPGAIGTAADDRFGVRQMLYGAAFAAGGSRIPFAGQALGKKIGELEAGKQKRASTKYGDLAKGYKVDDMNEEELRKLAGQGGARSVVAAQALMKKGLIRDDDDANRANNIEIIKRAREKLSGTDLGNTFDENLKKYNPSLAYSTVYEGNLEKLRSDLKTGKISIDKLMSSMSAEQVNKLKADLGGGDGAVAKFLMDNSDDIGKTIKGMKKESRQLVTDEIDHKTFAKRMNADGSVAEYDDEARKKYLSSRPADTMKVFDMENDEQVEKARKQFSKNRETILKEMDPEAMTPEFMKTFGDLASSKELDKFAERSFEHKDALKKALQGRLDEVLKELDFSTLPENIRRLEAKDDLTDAEKAELERDRKKQASRDEVIKKNLYAKGSLSEDFDYKAGSGEALARVIRGLDVDAAKKIKWNDLTSDQRIIVADNLGRGVLKSLAARGGNDDLVRGVKKSPRLQQKQTQLQGLNRELAQAQREVIDTGDASEVDRLTAEIEATQREIDTLRERMNAERNSRATRRNNQANSSEESDEADEIDIEEEE